MKGLIQGLLAAALVVLIGVWAVGQFGAAGFRLNAPAAAPTIEVPPTPNLQPTSQASAPTSQASAPTVATQPETAAIQQVIQRGNEAQAEAIAARDPSPMSGTATSDHYRELVRINTNLVDNGVSRIALLNLEWGPISVDGARATATTYETWRTSYADGTTEQSRDRNDYVLVRDAGAWKVQANTHPSEAATLPGQGAAPAPPTGATPGAAVDSRNTSRNWSGYAAGGGKFTAVGATWTVPAFTPDRPFGVDAAWVGIGGVRSRDLIQAGTSQTISSSGATQYQAWVETLPEAAEPVPLAVHPGDTITVTITEKSDDTWLLELVNVTTGEKYERTEQYDSSYSSAEWIQEAPSSGGGRLLPLGNFGSVHFSNAWAVKDGKRVNIAEAGGRPVTLIGADNQALAVPSEVGADGSSFSVARTEVPATMTGRQRRSRGGAAAD
jgi:hypothetical protein